MASIAKGLLAIGKALAKNSGNVAKGAGQVAKNTGQVAKGAGQVAKGAGQVAKGAEQVAKSAGQVARKAGPSGKPSLHFIDKSTKKEAYEAAKHAGKGEPIHHANPSNGKPHYHPNNNPKDSKGLDKNIKKDGTHYTYPK